MTFDPHAFALYALDTIVAHPLWFLLLAAAALIMAFWFAFHSGVRVTHRHEMDDQAPVAAGGR